MRKLSLQALSAVLAKAVIKVSNFFLVIVLARVLTPEAFGLYGVFFSALVIVVPFTSLGLRHAGAYMIGQGRLPEGAALATILWLLPALVLVSGAGMGLLVQPPAGLAVADLAGPALTAAAGFLLVYCTQGVFLGRNEIRWVNLVDVLPRLLVLAAVLVLEWQGRLDGLASLWALAGAMAASGLVALVLARPADGRIAWRAPRTPMLLRYGWPYAIVLGFSFLNYQISIPLVGAWADTVAAGHYFVATRLNGLPVEAAMAISMVLFSHATRSDDHQAALERAAFMCRWAIVFVILLAAAAFVVAPWLIPLLFGAEQAAAVPIFRILVLGLPFLVVTSTVYPTIAGIGRPLLAAMVFGPVVALNVTLSWFLIDAYGAGGAAIAATLAAVAAAAGFLALVRRFGVSPLVFLQPRRAEWSLLRTRLVALRPS
jgi:O-antigen/teichoic acid export membrane protein